MTSSPPSRGRRPRRPSGDDRERAILRTAERLLAERSLQDISVDDLARGAGISRPAFYFYFPSKEAVVLTLLDRMVLEARSARQAAFERAADDPRAMSRQALAAIHETLRSHPALSTTASRLCADNAEVRKIWLGLLEGFVDDTTAAIEAERAYGAAPPGPPARELAIALNWMNERTVLASYSGWDPSIGEDRVHECILTVWSRAIYGDDRLLSPAGPTSAPRHNATPVVGKSQPLPRRARLTAAPRRPLTAPPAGPTSASDQDQSGR